MALVDSLQLCLYETRVVNSWTPQNFLFFPGNFLLLMPAVSARLLAAIRAAGAARGFARTPTWKARRGKHPIGPLSPALRAFPRVVRVAPSCASDCNVHSHQKGQKAGRLCRNTMTASRRVLWASSWSAKASASGSAWPTAGSTCGCFSSHGRLRLPARARAPTRTRRDRPRGRVGRRCQCAVLAAHACGIPAHVRSRRHVRLRASEVRFRRCLTRFLAAGLSRCRMRRHGEPAGVYGMRAHSSASAPTRVAVCLRTQFRV